MWTDCSFPFGKDCSGVLVNCSLCATEATLFFDRPSMLQRFPLKFAPFCKLFAGLGSTNKSAISLLLLSDSRHTVLSCIFPFTSISQAEAVFSFFVLTGYNGSPDICFSWETARLMSWPDWERYLRPPQSPVALSSYFSYPLFSFPKWRRTISSKSFDTKVPSIFTEELVLPRCVRSRLRWNGPTLLFSSYLSWIGRIENPSCSACGHLSSHSALCSYGLCAARPLATLHQSGPDPGQVPDFGGFMVFCYVPSLERGRVTASHERKVWLN